jgi:hypothetical protein
MFSINQSAIKIDYKHNFTQGKSLGQDGIQKKARWRAETEKNALVGFKK